MEEFEEARPAWEREGAGAAAAGGAGVAQYTSVVAQGRRLRIFVVEAALLCSTSTRYGSMSVPCALFRSSNKPDYCGVMDGWWWSCYRSCKCGGGGRGWCGVAGKRASPHSLTFEYNPLNNSDCPPPPPPDGGDKVWNKFPMYDRRHRRKEAPRFWWWSPFRGGVLVSERDSQLFNGRTTLARK